MNIMQMIGSGPNQPPPFFCSRFCGSGRLNLAAQSQIRDPIFSRILIFAYCTGSDHRKRMAKYDSSLNPATIIYVVLLLLSQPPEKQGSQYSNSIARESVQTCWGFYYCNPHALLLCWRLASHCKTLQTFYRNLTINKIIKFYPAGYGKGAPRKWCKVLCTAGARDGHMLPEWKI